jgi:thiamine biosynthesis protein ThiC
LAFRVAKSNDRTDYTDLTYSPQRAVNGHGWVDIRETARDMRLRIDMIKNSDWSTIGPIILDIKPRGKKK